MRGYPWIWLLWLLPIGALTCLAFSPRPLAGRMLRR
jgi:hypothetical protein